MNIRRTLWWAGGAVLLIAAVLGGVIFTFIRTFYPSPPQAGPPATTLARSQRQDLEYFRHYLDLNHAYAPDARQQAATLLAGYEAQAGRLTPAQFELAIARMVALSDNGHSEDHPYLFRRRHNHLPCLLYRFSDGYHIVRARPACQALLGAELVAIDGHPVDEVAGRLFEEVRGPRNHYDQYASAFYLESPALLNAAGIAAAPDQVTLRVRMPDGSMRDVPMKADPPQANWPWWAWSDFQLSPLPIAAEGTDWTPVLPAGAALPSFLRQYDLPFRSESWPDKGVYYFALRANTDFNGHPIGEFLQRVRKEIAAARPRVVIADLRFDKGGNLTTTADLMSHLTTLSPAIRHVYVVTSAWTFSAGITSAALVKEHGGSKVTIIGEPVGDRLKFWAEGRDMNLPASHIQVHYATGLHDYTTPCWGESGCFWMMVFYPLHLKTLAPDVTIPYTFADYLALRDPVVDYVLREAATS